MNTHAALAMVQAANTLRMMMLSAGHTCIARIAEMLTIVNALCLNGTNAKLEADVTFDELILQAKAVPESEIQEISEPRCQL